MVLPTRTFVLPKSIYKHIRFEIEKYVWFYRAQQFYHSISLMRGFRILTQDKWILLNSVMIVIVLTTLYKQDM